MSLEAFSRPKPQDQPCSSEVDSNFENLDNNAFGGDAPIEVEELSVVIDQD